MSEAPKLKVVILKGPRAGETLEFADHVRIGRVIRGNTKGYKNNLVIKDVGVSTEHLSIHFVSGSWAVQDRGSSNGTFLNDNSLTPNTPFPLHSHDVLKIGELTSFSVIFSNHDNQETLTQTQAQVVPRRGRPRKVQDSNPDVNLNVKVSPVRTRTRARGKKIEETCDLDPIQEVTTGLNLEIANEGNKRRAGTRRPNKRLLPDTVPDREENQHASNLQVPFSNLVATDEEKNGNVEEEVSNLSPGGRVNDDGLDPGDDDSKVEGGVDVVAKGSSSNVDVADLAPVQEVTASLNLEIANEGNKRRVGTRRPNKRLLLEEAALDSVPDHKETQHTSNSQVPLSNFVATDEEKKGNVEEEMSNLSQGGRVNVAAGVDNDERLDRGEDNSKVAGSVGVAKGSSSNVDVPDLEKLTLGEWFDYLQVHLPKQIIDETEELIQNMGQKAIRVHEYRLQQMKGKESVG